MKITAIDGKLSVFKNQFLAGYGSTKTPEFGKNETDGLATNDPPSILARYLAKLGWVGGNYLQLML